MEDQNLMDRNLEQATGGVRSRDSEKFQVNVREGDDLNRITTNLRMNHGKLSQTQLSEAAQCCWMPKINTVQEGSMWWFPRPALRWKNKKG